MIFLAKQYLMWVMYWIFCDVKVIARKIVTKITRYMVSQFVFLKKVGVLALHNDIALFNVTNLHDILIAP